MTKVECCYCNTTFEYSKDEIKWISVFRKLSPDPVQDYFVTCKHCGKKIEFKM